MPNVKYEDLPEKWKTEMEKEADKLNKEKEVNEEAEKNKPE